MIENGIEKVSVNAKTMFANLVPVSDFARATIAIKKKVPTKMGGALLRISIKGLLTDIAAKLTQKAKMAGIIISKTKLAAAR